MRNQDWRSTGADTQVYLYLNTNTLILSVLPFTQTVVTDQFLPWQLCCVILGCKANEMCTSSRQVLMVFLYHWLYLHTFIHM
jgi:hypothetical protein